MQSIQRNLICTLKCQKQKRCKIVHDCLGNIAKVTGIQCMIIVFLMFMSLILIFIYQREYTIHIFVSYTLFLYIFLYFFYLALLKLIVLHCCTGSFPGYLQCVFAACMAADDLCIAAACFFHCTPHHLCETVFVNKTTDPEFLSFGQIS